MERVACGSDGVVRCGFTRYFFLSSIIYFDFVLRNVVYTVCMEIIFIDAGHPTSREALSNLAKDNFVILVKAVVDVRQRVMAIGGELHADEELFLSERHGSKREDTWGINLYPGKNGSDFLEFDSMVNLKPQFDNRSRDVLREEVRVQIRQIVEALVR